MFQKIKKKKLKNLSKSNHSIVSILVQQFQEELSLVDKIQWKPQELTLSKFTKQRSPWKIMKILTTEQSTRLSAELIRKAKRHFCHLWKGSTTVVTSLTLNRIMWMISLEKQSQFILKVLKQNWLGNLRWLKEDQRQLKLRTILAMEHLFKKMKKNNLGINDNYMQII